MHSTVTALIARRFQRRLLRWFCPATGTLLALTVTTAFATSADHQAVMDLVPINEASHVAVNDGVWSNPATWGGTVPDHGARVAVPTGLTVLYDVDGSPPLRWLRIDGSLQFRTDTATHLRVETVVNTGFLSIGSQAAPVAADIQAKITFVDGPPMDAAEDPMRLGRGLISMGAISLWGAPRLPRFAPLSVDTAVGSSVLHIEDQLMGWQPGDEIVVAGARYLGVLYTQPMTSNDDEVRQITGLDNGQLTLNAPLEHTHAGIPGQAWARPHVANLSCNVTLASAAGASTSVAERGHVMLMNQGVTIENVCFESLGRTDKSIPIDDPVINLDGTPGNGTNPRGRYSIHMHHMGVDHQNNWMQQPATVRGCVVRDSPGWGVAIHQSHGVVEDCVSFQVFGAHFVTEDGNELGAFRRNLALQAPGGIDERGYKDGVGNHDLGHSGCGFWVQGRDFGVEDNVAAGMGDAGFCWFHRSLVFDATNPMTVQVENISHPMRPYLHLRAPIIVDGVDYGDFAYNDVPISQVRNNLTYASGTGYRITKANPVQLGDQFSVLAGLKSFNVDEALFHEYTRHYFYDELSAFGNQPDNPFRIGITSFALADHLAFRNPSVSGFGSCLRTNLFFEGQLDHPNILLINPDFSDCLQEWENFAPDNPRGSIQLSIDTLPGLLETIEFVPADDQDYVLPTNPTILGNDFVLRGQVIDAASTWPLELVWPGPYLARQIAEHGFHLNDSGNRVVRLVTRIHSRADPRYFTDHVFLVQLPELYGNALGPNNGSIPPHIPNASPTASDFTFLVTADAGFRIDISADEGLLSKALDPEGDTLQVHLTEVHPPVYGVVSIAPNGGFMYRRTVFDHNLTDHFTYRVHDTWSSSNQATVTLVLDDSDQLFIDQFEH